MQLYINDQLTDLSDDNPIALTFQINNLADVKNQQGNTSNQFKLPLTQRNRQILGFPDDVAFCTNLPYQKYQAKLIQDGLEIIPYGIAELNGTDGDSASITVLSGNVDFFDAIDGKLYDMGDSTSPWTNYGQNMVWQAYEHKWTLENIVKSQYKTEGWIWPMVDYGLISSDIVSQPFKVDVRYLRPGFFLKTAIELLAKNAGYKINPNSSLVNNDMYGKLIVQFANDAFQHGTDYQNGLDSLSVVLTKQQSQPINPNKQGPATARINFEGIKANDYNLIHDSTYVASEPVKVNIELNYGLQIIDTTPAGGGSLPYIEIRLMKYSFGTSSQIAHQQHQVINKSGGGVLGIGHHDGAPSDYLKQKLTGEVSLETAESIGIEYYLFPSINRVKGTFYSDATLNITNKLTDVVYNQDLQCERIFPDISMKDLLKDALQHFGIICQTDNAGRTITFASFADIVKNIPIAKNWTNKCLDQGKNINFQLGGYSQSNYMQYKQDDNVLPLNFADSQINIADTTLPAQNTLFESQFAPTLNRPYNNGSIAQIKKVDTSSDAESTDFSISTEPRLLIDEKYNLLNSGKTVVFTDGVKNMVQNDMISVPYFYKNDGEHSLLWKDLKAKYYPELEKILTQSKKVIRWFILTPRDILELDLLIPVYIEQDSSYYYINKIDAWRKGQPTKVELVKLG